MYGVGVFNPAEGLASPISYPETSHDFPKIELDPG
jgi:hypothetical protein